MSSTYLSQTDVCDRCGAKAQVLVVFSSGLDLVFCHYHSVKYRTALQSLPVVLFNRYGMVQNARTSKDS